MNRTKYVNMFYSETDKPQKNVFALTLMVQRNYPIMCFTPIIQNKH